MFMEVWRSGGMEECRYGDVEEIVVLVEVCRYRGVEEIVEEIVVLLEVWRCRGDGVKKH